MPDIASARELAVQMRDIGVRAGRPTVCELTAMDSPLGAAVGNALEVAEACEMLAGRGPVDFRELVLGSAARMAVLSDLGVDLSRRPSARGDRRRLGRGAAGAGAARGGAGRRSPARRAAVEVLETAPVVVGVAAPRAGSVLRCGALRSAVPPCASVPVARARKIPSTTPSASSSTPSPATTSRPASRSRTCTPGTPAHAERAVAEVLAAFEIVDAPVEHRRSCSRRSADARAPRGRDGPPPLLPHLSGRTLAEVEVLDYRLTDPEPPEAVAARLQGVAHRDARPPRQVPHRRARRRRRAARTSAYDREPALARRRRPLRLRASCAPGATRRRLLSRPTPTRGASAPGASQRTVRRPGSPASSAPSRSTIGWPPTWRAPSRAGRRP